MKKTTFIFDLDGVLVDTARFHFIAWKKIADEIGIPFTETDNEKLKGINRAGSLEKILELDRDGHVRKQIDAATFDHYLHIKNRYYLELIDGMNTSSVLPGVMRTLDFLKTMGCRIALGSASRNARTILQKIHIESYFDAIVDGNDVKRTKPDPEVFILAARKTSSTPASCVVLEDSVAGLQAAEKAGMMGIGIGDHKILSSAAACFLDFNHLSESFLTGLIQDEQS